VGSRLLSGSLELRIPLAESDRFGLIRASVLPIELAPFLDAAVAWTSTNSPSFTFARSSPDRIPVFSTGLSARINLLGYTVVEVYYAHPFQRPAKSWVLGFQLAPGW
jgi:outer membrane protein assembly factor BamA